MTLPTSLTRCASPRGAVNKCPVLGHQTIPMTDYIPTIIALTLTLGCAPPQSVDGGFGDTTEGICEAYMFGGIEWTIEAGWSTGAQIVDPAIIDHWLETGHWVMTDEYAEGCMFHPESGSYACTIQRECGLLFGLPVATLGETSPGCNEVGDWDKTITYFETCLGVFGAVAVPLDTLG